MKTIVWDVDDVLNDLMRDWLDKGWHVEHPERKVAYEEIIQNPPHDVLGISKEDYLSSLDRFRHSFGSEMKPIPEMLSWFHEFGANFRHVALTSVPMQAADISAAWVMRYFGHWIRSFNVVPSPRNGYVIPDYGHSKKEYLQWLGCADIFIDDSELNVNGVQELGIISFLMPAPWNKAIENRKQLLMRLNKLID